MTQPTPQTQPAQPARIHPERQRRVKQALQFFTVTAWVTGVLLLLLVARMIMQYGFDMNVDYLSWVARVHGFAFVAFLMASLNLGSKARWSAGTWIATALSGVVPFMSFIIEGKRRNEVKEKFQLS